MLLVLCMLSTLFAACGEKPRGPEPGTPTSPTGTEPGAEEKEYVLEVFDWSKREVSLLVNHNPSSVWGDIDFTSKEEDAGEPVNDAGYRRNLEIEEMFNIKLVIKPVNRDGHTTAIRTSVMAGDGAYDITFNTPRENHALMGEGHLLNLFDIDSVDLKAPFYDQNAVKGFSIANKLYMVTGNYGIMYLMSVSSITFNKQLVRDYGLTSPYKFLEDNTWTIDNMVKLCKDYMGNIDNGDLPFGSINRAYGMVGFRDTLPLTVLGSGIPFVTKNTDDIPAVTFWSERTVDAFEKITDLLYDRNMFFNWQKDAPTASGAYARAIFEDNRALFYWGELQGLGNLRNMDGDFGIMPVPKYDSNQVSYSHSINPWVAMTMALPVRPDGDIEKIGAIVNAISKLGKDYLLPAYYEKTLTGKLSRDDESEVSIDIIVNNVNYDLGFIFNWGNIGNFMLSMVDARNKDLASAFAAIENTVNLQMEATVDKVLNLD